MEASAMLVVFRMIETGAVKLLSSEVLRYENARNPHPERAVFVEVVLSSAVSFQSLDEQIRERAKAIQLMGIQTLDALHLASAERLRAGRVLTVDDTVLRRYRGAVIVQNPVRFVQDYAEKEKP